MQSQEGYITAISDAVVKSSLYLYSQPKVLAVINGFMNSTLKVISAVI